MQAVSALRDSSLGQLLTHFAERIRRILARRRDSPRGSSRSPRLPESMDGPAIPRYRERYSRLVPGSVDESWFPEHEDPVDRVKDMDSSGRPRRQEESEWLR